ncbi:class I SAM-dependent methyltransferase [Kitasatospora sp. NPDC093550]|uniref:class I SAM-dependent methyltransferase n=1 Tax=Kitasatospora sp. NPDC093550 TaxID=3364089 RepID=UPI0037FF5405
MTDPAPDPAPDPTPDLVAYFDLRTRLLGPLRNQPLTSDQLCEVGRILSGSPDGLSLYDVPAPRMVDRGIRLLGRTALECVKDPHPALVATALTEVLAEIGTDARTDGLTDARTDRPATGHRPLIADLFCGSGNLGHQLGRALGPRFGHRVHATELDPLVHDFTRHNLALIGSPVRLRHADYRELLTTSTAPHGRSRQDVYLVEPPWDAGFTATGLDLTRTTPPVPDILDDIRRSRGDHPCVVVLKTSDLIAHDTLAAALRGATLLRTVCPRPVRPRGMNARFHLYRV